jgi:hypothetical protein
MMRFPPLRVIMPLLLLAACTVHSASEFSLAPEEAAVSEANLRRDLFALAGDGMRGREAGTLDELRASAWVAERARAAGLEPAGDDGTYFQWFPMRRVRTNPASLIVLGGDTLRHGRDAVVLSPVAARLDLPLVVVDAGDSLALRGMDLRGRAVVARLATPDPLPGPDVSLKGYRVVSRLLRQRAAQLARQGAAAVVLVSDAAADGEWTFLGGSLARGRYALDSAGTSAAPVGRGADSVPVVWVRASRLAGASAAGARLRLDLRVDDYGYPSVNVVARAPGRDPALRAEHVLVSAHQDHDGVRLVASGDSIWNGADDNATASVAALEIGRLFARRPGRRSLLVVWHGAEERGLLGSRWHASRPTVDRQSIVAVLNADMLGRNHPDSAALLGAQPPHRNSAALARIALDANARTTRFVVDSSWDRLEHPEGWYFRSDHLPYARAGIPALFFTTLLHPDYHTERDDPERIDLTKLARMTRWMYETARAVAEADARPAVDPEARLER